MLQRSIRPGPVMRPTPIRVRARSCDWPMGGWVCYSTDTLPYGLRLNPLATSPYPSVWIYVKYMLKSPSLNLA